VLAIGTSSNPANIVFIATRSLYQPVLFITPRHPARIDLQHLVTLVLESKPLPVIGAMKPGVVGGKSGSLQESIMFKPIVVSTALSLSLSLALSLALPLVAHADGYRNTEYTTVSQPRQQCWNEQVAVGYRDNSGAIVGGIAGGIIGNQVGRGNGRVVATAVGALTGTIVGENLSNHGQGGYQTVQRCRTVYEQVQVPVARSVTYSQPYVQPTYVAPAPVVVYEEGYRHHRHHHHHHHDQYCHHERY
jgi:outer membrane lipoprotein SlyB